MAWFMAFLSKVGRSLTVQRPPGETGSKRAPERPRACHVADPPPTSSPPSPYARGQCHASRTAGIQRIQSPACMCQGLRRSGAGRDKRSSRWRATSNPAGATAMCAACRRPRSRRAFAGNARRSARWSAMARCSRLQDAVGMPERSSVQGTGGRWWCPVRRRHMLQKSSAGACQASISRCQMDARYCGSILAKPGLRSPGQPKFPGARRKLARALQGVQALRGLQGGFRGGAGITDPCCSSSSATNSTRRDRHQLIKGRVAGDLEQPGGKARLGASDHRLVGVEEGLLRPSSVVRRSRQPMRESGRCGPDGALFALKTPAHRPAGRRAVTLSSDGGRISWWTTMSTNQRRKCSRFSLASQTEAVCPCLGASQPLPPMLRPAPPQSQSRLWARSGAVGSGPSIHQPMVIRLALPPRRLRVHAHRALVHQALQGNVGGAGRPVTPTMGPGAALPPGRRAQHQHRHGAARRQTTRFRPAVGRPATCSLHGWALSSQDLTHSAVPRAWPRPPMSPAGRRSASPATARHARGQGQRFRPMGPGRAWYEPPCRRTMRSPSHAAKAAGPGPRRPPWRGPRMFPAWDPGPGWRECMVSSTGLRAGPRKPPRASPPGTHHVAGNVLHGPGRARSSMRACRRKPIAVAQCCTGAPGRCGRSAPRAARGRTLRCRLDPGCRFRSVWGGTGVPASEGPVFVRLKPVPLGCWGFDVARCLPALRGRSPAPTSPRRGVGPAQA